MKELVVISGKGGTGKTSIVASFAAMAERTVLADCDVDAADLHLIVQPELLKSEDFSGGSQARILPERCLACGKCKEFCRFEAITEDGPGNEYVSRTFRVDPMACEGCGVCAAFCPQGAIEFEPAVNGKWFVSDTRYGPMVHARLSVGGENSGKLVNLVRANAKKIAQELNIELVIIDGSPGIGCPVIASIAASDLVVIICEPTLSGLHDFKRIAELTRHFKINSLVCVNKWDLNPEMTSRIENIARHRGLKVAGRIRYDRAASEAQLVNQPVVTYAENGIVRDIQHLWYEVLYAY